MEWVFAGSGTNMLSQVCSEKVFKKHLALYLNITMHLTLTLYLKPY